MISKNTQREESEKIETTQNINIKIENFEGPFDLLLYLVKNSKININSIPISSITKQFVEKIKFFESIDLDLYSNFILTISMLMYIKSKSLLPVEIELDEEIDERTKLAEGLIEYRKYKQAAEILKDNFEKERILVRRDTQLRLDFKDDDNWQEISIVELIMAFSRLAKEVDSSIFKALEIEKISIDDKIDEINELLLKYETIMFSSLFAEDSTKYELIITFLALLELVKMEKIVILQHKLFGDIKIIRKQGTYRHE